MVLMTGKKLKYYRLLPFLSQEVFLPDYYFPAYFCIKTIKNEETCSNSGNR
jgi:hypothetical protein